MTYSVWVNENSHYMDDEERYKIGDFDSRDAAIACCKDIVERSLTQCGPSADADEIFRMYTTFGDDPWIATDDSDCRFSAWDYARERCREIAAGR